MLSALDRRKLSQMISTIDVNNGFRDDLLPMALSSIGSASDGLRNAMLAVSAFHLWGPEQALSYKADALRSLSSSLSSESVGITETQLATSMMLCVYNVSSHVISPNRADILIKRRYLMRQRGIGICISTVLRLFSTNLLLFTGDD